jgi:hypothetical protein
MHALLLAPRDQAIAFWAKDAGCSQASLVKASYSAPAALSDSHWSAHRRDLDWPFLN